MTNNIDVTRRKFLKVCTGTSIGLLIPYIITTKSQKSEASIEAACGLIVLAIGAYILGTSSQSKKIGIGFRIDLKNSTDRTERVNLYFSVTDKDGNPVLPIDNDKDYIINLEVPGNGKASAKWKWWGIGYTNSLYLTVKTDCATLVNRKLIQKIL